MCFKVFDLKIIGLESAILRKYVFESKLNLFKKYKEYRNIM